MADSALAKRAKQASRQERQRKLAKLQIVAKDYRQTSNVALAWWEVRR